MSKDVHEVAAHVFGDKIHVDYDGAGAVVFTPAEDSGLDRPEGAIAFWADKKDEIQNFLKEYGAILLRGFGLTKTSEFAAVIERWPSHNLGYAGGGGPRESVEGRIMESTRLPPDFSLPLHQEMAYLPHYPEYLAFFCHVAPGEGGETPIGDMRKLTKLVPDGIREAMQRHGLDHLRWFPNGNGQQEAGDQAFFGRSWQDAFATESKEDVERDCREAGMECRWREDDSLYLRVHLPGYVNHPRTHERIWFNSLHIMAPSPDLHGVDAYDDVLKKRAKGEPLVSDTTFGNGEPIPIEYIRDMLDLYRKIKTSTPWQVGDIMFLDNYLMAHGREPFSGDRDIQVALLA